MESILTTTKKMLGISEDCTQFDTDIIIHVNTALLTLNQLGVGPSEPAFINSDLDTWSGTLGDSKSFEAVKTYIYLKVRMLFDPPTSTSVIESMNRQINELEWRLNVQSEITKEV